MKTSLIRSLSLGLVLGLLSIAALAGQLGGYRVVDKADDGVVAAADAAVKAQSEQRELTYKLISIEKAESKAVAGTLYRLCLKVGYHKQDDDVDATEFVKVEILRNLQGQHELQSWTQEDCGSDGE